jgi:hypothetical protein
MEKLRIYIDGDWQAKDFAAFFMEIHGIYDANKFAFIDTTSSAYDQVADLALPIRVLSVQYGSPGFTDLMGVGAIIKELRSFLEFLILHFREGADRKLSREEKEIEILKLKLQLLEGLERMRKGSSEGDEIKAFERLVSVAENPEIEALCKAILDKRIAHVEIARDESRTA